MSLISISGSTVLEFPNLKKLKNLNQIHIDRFSKPTFLKNISTAPNLKELQIGTFTFNGPILLESFDEIIKCTKLEKLYLSYSKFSEAELKRIIEMKSLREFGVHQKIETDTLAYLSTKLTNVKSNELKAWQLVPKNWGDKNIKINGNANHI